MGGRGRKTVTKMENGSTEEESWGVMERVNRIKMRQKEDMKAELE